MGGHQGRDAGGEWGGEVNVPQVTRLGILDMQVCVPAEWTDSEVISFANTENHCGTENGWQIRRQGCPALGGMPERNPCNDRQGFVHIMLDA